MLAFDLVGGWTSPNLFLRTLTLGDPQWEPLRAGFTHRPTGDRVTLTLSPASPTLAASFAAGIDPFHPTIDEALLAEIATHQSVVTVSAPATSSPLTLVRAADAVVTAGALAVRCRTSGLSHGADGFQVLAAALEAASANDRVEALFALYVHVRAPSTVGMHALGAADLALAAATDPDRDLARLRAAAIALLRGTTTVTPRPDDRGLLPPMLNPIGLATVEL